MNPEIEKPSTILKTLPKNTPSWAVGLVSIILSFGSLIIVLYMTVRPEVLTSINESYKAEALREEHEQNNFTKVLDLVSAQAQQIAVLSEDSLKLRSQVIEIKNQLSLSQSEYKQCLKSLEICNSTKGEK